MPFDWRGDGWRDDVAALPKYAELAAELGANRCSTWCPPTSTERAFDENFAWHVERYGAIAEVLKSCGIRFGIEFIGPQTLRPADQHDFIYNMEGMLELATAIGTGNVGLLLDAWHLYTSGGAVEDLDKISNADIVNVHVNDAPQGLTMATYNDHDRRLPTETDVLPLEAFMKKLIALGYDGPVTPEPFSKRLNEMGGSAGGGPGDGGAYGAVVAGGWIGLDERWADLAVTQRAARLKLGCRKIDAGPARSAW